MCLCFNGITAAPFLLASTQAVLARVVAHLQLSPLSPGALADATAPSAGLKANARSAGKRSIAMPPTAGRVLAAFYAPFNRELAALTMDDGFLWLPRAGDGGGGGGGGGG